MDGSEWYFRQEINQSISDPGSTKYHKLNGSEWCHELKGDEWYFRQEDNQSISDPCSTKCHKLNDSECRMVFSSGEQSINQ